MATLSPFQSIYFINIQTARKSYSDCNIGMALEFANAAYTIFPTPETQELITIESMKNWIQPWTSSEYDPNSEEPARDVNIPHANN